MKRNAGPVMVVTVPEIRKRFFGYKPVERPPTSYPRECQVPSASSAQVPSASSAQTCSH